MFAELRAALRPTFVLLAFFTVLTGLAYPLLITAIAQVAMPSAANGSLIRQNGHVIGSALIGQTFTQARYFHARPSAAGKSGYDASSSTGSNLAPGAKALADRITGDVAALRKAGVSGPIPADLVTASGSGLDPDITPEAALVQVPRIARARGIDQAGLRRMIAAATTSPVLGVIGAAHLNVLQINRQLDANGRIVTR
jgi:K+-transporting ATPase ATPase C chain